MAVALRYALMKCFWAPIIWLGRYTYVSHDRLIQDSGEETDAHLYFNRRPLVPIIWIARRLLLTTDTYIAKPGSQLVFYKRICHPIIWIRRWAFLATEFGVPTCAAEQIFYLSCANGDLTMIKYMFRNWLLRQEWFSNWIDNCLEYAAANGHAGVVSFLLGLPEYGEFQLPDVVIDAIRSANRGGHYYIAAQINKWMLEL